jgi:hypothetical protein
VAHRAGVSAAWARQSASVCAETFTAAAPASRGPDREDLRSYSQVRHAVDHRDLRDLFVADLDRFRDLRRRLTTTPVERRYAEWQRVGDETLVEASPSRTASGREIRVRDDGGDRVMRPRCWGTAVYPLVYRAVYQVPAFATNIAPKVPPRSRREEAQIPACCWLPTRLCSRLSTLRDSHDRRAEGASAKSRRTNRF